MPELHRVDGIHHAAGADKDDVDVLAVIHKRLISGIGIIVPQRIIQNREIYRGQGDHRQHTYEFFQLTVHLHFNALSRLSQNWK